MAISTNGTVLARVAGALYNTQLSNATYQEVASIVTTSASLNALVNDLYARDFASTKDLTVAQTLVSNLGLSTVAGLDNWVAAQITAAGAANKGAKIVELLNSFAQMSSDETYGTAAAAFNARTDSALSLSQTSGNAGGTFSAVSTAIAGKTFTLTTGTETIAGSAGDDTINAPLSSSAVTYSAIDQIAGGSGIDSIYVENNGSAVNFTTQTGLENIRINQSSQAGTVTLASDKAYTNLESVGSATGLTFNAIAKGTTTAGLTSNTGDVTLAYSSTALTGAADNLAVTLNNAGGTLTVSGGTASNALETVTLNSISDSTLTALALGSANATSLVITGSGNTTVTAITDTAATLRTIDASASTGKVSVTGIHATSNTITGGSGNDTLAGAAGNDVISSGAGNDSVTGAAGNDNVALGGGNDTFVVTGSDLTKDDTIVGGEGTDTLTLTGTIAYTAATTTDAALSSGSGISEFEVLKSGGDVTQDMRALPSTITSVSVGANTVTLTKDTAIANATFTGAGTLSIASAGAQTLTLGGLSGTTPTVVTGANFTTFATTLAIVSNGDDGASSENTVTVADTALTGITVTGAERVTVTNTSTTLTSADFSGNTSSAVGFSNSAATGAIKFTPGSGKVASLTTGAGADSITLTAGADVVTASGAGADTITAGAGNDTITSSGSGADVIDLGDGDDTVTTSSTGADSISGGAGNDSITAGDDNDTVDGGAGNDILAGDAGDDSLTGGDGNDTITDGTGNDMVVGGAGNDVLTISSGNDNVSGGDGNDTISITGLSAGDTIDGGAGTDSLAVTNSSTATITPTVTGIESMSIVTSAALTADFYYVGAGLTSLTVSSSGSDKAVSISNLLNGTTVSITEDNSNDNASATDTDDDGTIGAVTIDGATGASINVSLLPNIDTGVDVLSNYAAVLITDSIATVISTSGGSSSNYIQHDFDSLALDAVDARTLTINAAAYSGVTTGAITETAALEELTITAAAGSDVDIGTIATGTVLTTMSLTAAGATSTINYGAIGGTVAPALTSISMNASAGGVITATSGAAIGSTNANSVALTSLSLASTGRGSNVDIGTIATNGKGITTLTVSAADFSTIGEGVIDTTTAATITTANLTLGDDTTITASGDFDIGASSSGQTTITTLNATFGTRITSAGNGFDLMHGTSAIVTTANITVNQGSDAVNFNEHSDYELSIGGTGNEIMLIDLRSVTATTGSLVFSATGSGAVVVDIGSSAALTSTASAKITGGSGADSLVGHAGADTISGGSGNDTLNGLAGADSLSGGDGADTLFGGDGADTLVGGAGYDLYVFDATSGTTDTAFVTGTAITSATITTNDRISGFATGDILRFNTTGISGSGLTLTKSANTVTAPTNDSIVYIAGSYSGTTFTADSTVTAATTGYATLVVVDMANGVSTNYQSILLIGYLDGTTVDAISTTGVTGLVGSA
jgi:Ca2+-binding RTX toxin-like protein